MRIHLGHHFYGAGNLGDDFMLAGFLAAWRLAAPPAKITGCVPFALEPLQSRFPEIRWQPYDDSARDQAIDGCDVWLGLGGSPFQSALSRWFVDHLAGELERCRRFRKPMFYLGVGVQTEAELQAADIPRLCQAARAIWTRDRASAERLRALTPDTPIHAAADLGHAWFAAHPPPPARAGRITLVVNVDYGTWPGRDACLQVLARLGAREHIWLAQETRPLPGAERLLHATLPPTEQRRWRLHVPDRPGAPLVDILPDWPSGEWLITSRFHAALAGLWAGSRVVVIGINEKLRGLARELDLPLIDPAADAAAVEAALERSAPARPPRALAQQAREACAAFARAASAVAPSG